MEEWEVKQVAMASHVVLTDSMDFSNAFLVGGVDISFDKDDSDLCAAYITVIDIRTLSIVYEDHLVRRLTIPYKSGFLGFREVPLYLELIERLREKARELVPQVILVDGFGILHHRGVGSASHLAIECGIPSIGVGKTLLCMDGLNEKEFKSLIASEWKQDRRWFPIVGNSGKLYGKAFSNSGGNPIYVTVGSGIGLDTACSLIERLCLYRIPEPIRNSDIQSKKVLLEEKRSASSTG